MAGSKEFLPTISSLVALGEFAQTAPLDEQTATAARSTEIQQQQAEAEWQAAIAALSHLLTQQLPPQSRATSTQGVLLSGPFPVLENTDLMAQLSSWTFIPQTLEQLALTFTQLMPAEYPASKEQLSDRLLPLIEDDPLAAERFCLVLTQSFSLILVLGKDANGEIHFQFSFTPRIVESVWQQLRSRVHLVRPQQLERLEPLVETFAPREPDYRLVSHFSRLLLTQLPRSQPPQRADAAEAAPAVQYAYHEPTDGTDTELLKAMAHEIRTPLTTIRTFTRSLLKRKDLQANVKHRLQQIDRECTRQIDRFNLIFHAVELEATNRPRSPLTAISLSQIFQDAIPQWQHAAQRRNLSLDVELPSQLPSVASDPALLRQVLTGLVELFTHSIPANSHIQMQVMLAGHQLKLQFQSQLASPANACIPPPLQALGNLLMFQPETGGVSLNLKATKNLFHALGAKLIVRDRSAQEATWTVFLPLETTVDPSAYRIV
ncbi:HAMP domain-containing histidine kinase [Romeria aff. gracilis LEGE 07310]|uniref:histidine kinase n=1 Tax=Vasconcelosia minhoensis LEGE 07310 TaxID=915328 RepID=A0A8J7A500_9CYAN|nr:HAMP domain-containing sensor histidine kinase [Romeria gracilis]MBE9076030.1 HAMP domain-containing histidine kinase [Romeria aff. gracilis LEGE 07310]